MPGHDPDHWLHKHTPAEWMRAAMTELSGARKLYAGHDARGGLASARRAAGMAWNAVLAIDAQPAEAFGRSYVDHLRAIADGAAVGEPMPAAVRASAKLLVDEPDPKPGGLVQLLSPRRDARMTDAAETVLAEAYARLLRRGLLTPGRAAAAEPA